MNPSSTTPLSMLTVSNCAAVSAIGFGRAGDRVAKMPTAARAVFVGSLCDRHLSEERIVELMTPPEDVDVAESLQLGERRTVDLVDDESVSAGGLRVADRLDLVRELGIADLRSCCRDSTNNVRRTEAEGFTDLAIDCQRLRQALRATPDTQALCELTE